MAGSVRGGAGKGANGIGPEDETGRLKSLGMWVEGRTGELFR